MRNRRPVYQKALLGTLLVFLLGPPIRVLWRLAQHSRPQKVHLEENFLEPLASTLLPSGGPSVIPLSHLDPCENLYHWVCEKSGITRDPTGVVHPDIEGERQAVKLYEEIIRHHPGWSVEQVDEELAQEIFEPKKRARIVSTFRWVKRTLERFIEQQPDSVFTALEKFQIKFRLQKTHLEIPPPASLYSDEPDILTRNEAFYERTSNQQMRLRIGGAYLFVAKSWFNLVFTLAHELAHSIDPCEIRTIRLSFPAYDRLEACFLQNHLISLSKQRAECGANDQMAEAFADWIAVQISIKALKLYATEFDRNQVLRAARNSVRDLCEQKDETNEIDTELHPSPQTRIELIFGKNSEIRKLLGCQPMPNTTSECHFHSNLKGSYVH